MASIQVQEAMPGFTFGADPELFIMDDKGRYVTAEGLIPGTKAEPYKVEYGAVQVDGMAAEFNIDPVSTFVEFDRNITAVMRTLKNMLPRGYSLRAESAVTFDQEQWDLAPPEAKVLGCTPDFNAWTGDVNPPPNCDDKPTLRTASGHVHIGWTNGVDPFDADHMTHCRDLVKQLDWYLGGWSLLQDDDPTRRLLYGKAGAMRFKPYGVEYRVLSNFWLKGTNSRRAVWNRMNAAIWKMSSDYLPDKWEPYQFNESLVQCINTSTVNPYLFEQVATPLKRLPSIGANF